MQNNSSLATQMIRHFPRLSASVGTLHEFHVIYVRTQLYVRHTDKDLFQLFNIQWKHDTCNWLQADCFQIY